MLPIKAQPKALPAAPTPARRTTTCSLETRHLFAKRLLEKGWELRSDIQAPPSALVAGTWSAMDSIYGAGILETPLEPSQWLLEAAGSAPASVHLKMEALQVSGSFKARGAAHKLLGLSPEELAAGVFTSSTGNHALAVLHACRQLAEAGRHVAATIYVPATLTPTKRAKLDAAAAASGARLITHGSDCLEAEVEARAAAARAGGVYISPYNDVDIVAGQGTIAAELLMQLPRGKLDAVLVPVGGGGLIAGIAALLKSVDPGIRIIGCQPAVSDVMRRSVDEGAIVELPWEETLSDGTAGGVEPGAITLDPCIRFVDEWCTVREDEIAAALVGVSKHHGVLVEGSAAVAVASFLKMGAALRGQHVVIVCCGGNASSSVLERAYELMGRGATASMG